MVWDGYEGDWGEGLEGVSVVLVGWGGMGR